ncbi:unnamed protein product [Cercospora beticola]|nr:unnamed protein product [Cercospora beticola]
MDEMMSIFLHAEKSRPFPQKDDEPRPSAWTCAHLRKTGCDAHSCAIPTHHGTSYYGVMMLRYGTNTDQFKTGNPDMLLPGPGSQAFQLRMHDETQMPRAKSARSPSRCLQI